MDLFFKVAYFVGMIVEIIVRAPYDRKRRAIEKTDQRVTVAEQVVLWGLLVATLILPLAYALTPWLRFADYTWSPVTRGWLGGLGLAFLAAAILLFWRTHRDLGAYWSPSLEIGANHRLVTQGVYRAIRHPMYSSYLLWGFAQVLLLSNWIAGPASLAGFMLLYFVRIPSEEAMMLDHFGDEYLDYRTRTGRIVPHFRRA